MDQGTYTVILDSRNSYSFMYRIKSFAVLSLCSAKFPSIGIRAWFSILMHKTYKKKINYNMHKDKWKMSELIAICAQEEERLKVQKSDMAHLTTLGPTKKIFKKGKSKKKKNANDETHKANEENKTRCHFCRKKVI